VLLAAHLHQVPAAPDRQARRCHAHRVTVRSPAAPTFRRHSPWGERLCLTRPPGVAVLPRHGWSAPRLAMRAGRQYHTTPRWTNSMAHPRPAGTCGQWRAATRCAQGTTPCPHQCFVALVVLRQLPNREAWTQRLPPRHLAMPVQVLHITVLVAKHPLNALRRVSVARALHPSIGRRVQALM